MQILLNYIQKIQSMFLAFRISKKIIKLVNFMSRLADVMIKTMEESQLGSITQKSLDVNIQLASDDVVLTSLPHSLTL